MLYIKQFDGFGRVDWTGHKGGGVMLYIKHLQQTVDTEQCQTAKQTPTTNISTPHRTAMTKITITIYFIPLTPTVAIRVQL